MAVEPFSFKKWFFSLIPASGEQWGKWMDFIWKLAIVILVYLFIWIPVRDRFFSKPAPIPTQTIGTNQGTVNTDNSKTDKKGWQLLGGLIQINN